MTLTQFFVWGLLQWSPPLNGGSTGIRRMRGWVIAWPQWSPPLNGGSTRSHMLRVPNILLAAMEPAVERREHSVLTYWGQFVDHESLK